VDEEGYAYDLLELVAEGSDLTGEVRLWIGRGDGAATSMG